MNTKSREVFTCKIKSVQLLDSSKVK